MAPSLKQANFCRCSWRSSGPSGPDDNEVWDSIESRVEALVNEKIPESVYNQTQADLEGLQNVLQEYADSAKPGHSSTFTSENWTSARGEMYLTSEIYSTPVGTADDSGLFLLPWQHPTQPPAQVTVWAEPNLIDAIQVTYPNGAGPNGVSQTSWMGANKGASTVSLRKSCERAC